ncbi:hypothetical protein GNI_019980 [Gregarina niphandrodes]|uniref:PH domain-containing protein n=1 Tax=Gregarina niphandrodes TaxID=110365 RepID=A0A023BC20_GRENI|nr:hypothetical protein GNI_019980 [Gregarina niphandrodes]EZG81147.1 hypothetical protein GNI_019980 [Gregarina niphandrodes]|eukprot:XP_011134262.1 hypothetical protein GNI_019980 [Gregarina niphandrodes]
MAYTSLNGQQLNRRIGLREPEKPPMPEVWESRPRSTNPLSLDEIGADLKKKNMMPAGQPLRATVYCTTQPEEVRPRGAVPEAYEQICRRMGLPTEHLVEAFGAEGFRVDKCFSAWKAGTDVLEVWKVDLFLSPFEPLIKIYFRRHKTSRLLLPDLYLQPLTHPMAVDCFADYQWPNGDRELLDIRHTSCVVGSFRNAREPVLFVCDNETRRSSLITILAVVTELAKIEHVRRRERFVSRSMPTTIGRQGDPGYSEELNAHFAEFLHEAALRLGTSAACAKYWRRSRRTWVLTWSGKKYVKKRYYLTIHRNQPFLMTLKSETKTGCFTEEYDYTAHSSSRACNSVTQKHSWSSFMKSERLAPHLTFVDNMRDDKPRTFFSFETSEDLKDFQQVIATLGYIHLRKEAGAEDTWSCPQSSSTDPAMEKTQLGVPGNNQLAVPAQGSCGQISSSVLVSNNVGDSSGGSPQFYEAPPLYVSSAGEPGHVFTASSFIPNPASTAVVNADGIRMVPRRAPKGSLFAPPAEEEEDTPFYNSYGLTTAVSSTTSSPSTPGTPRDMHSSPLKNTTAPMAAGKVATFLPSLDSSADPNAGPNGHLLNAVGANGLRKHRVPLGTVEAAPRETAPVTRLPESPTAPTTGNVGVGVVHTRRRWQEIVNFGPDGQVISEKHVDLGTECWQDDTFYAPVTRATSSMKKDLDASSVESDYD